MHEKPSCDPADKDGKKTAAQAAGGHFDPDTTKVHKGPGGGGPVAVARRIGSLVSTITSRLVGRRSQPAGI